MFIILFYSLESSLSQKCGFSDNSTRIVGGEDAGFLKWPWMAHLKLIFEDTTKPGKAVAKGCGGTLINDEWVLTAGHCLTEPGPQYKYHSVEVTLGEHDTTKDEGKEVKIFSDELIPHESYNKSNPTEKDIALIKLKEKLDFNGKHKYLQPICLPPKGIKVDPNRCYATGWGDTSHGGETSDILKEVKLPIIDNDYCKKVWAKSFESDVQLCGGGEEGRDVCSGDSGGPLQCQLANNVWVQEGINSFVSKCGDNVPSVFVRVSAHLSWIKSKTGIK